MARGCDLTLSVDRRWGQPPAVPTAVVQRVVTEAGWTWRVLARFHDDPPPAAPPGPTEALWEHEVVEVFVVGADGTYLEIELGPRGHHLALGLTGPREVAWRARPLAVRTAVVGGWWAGEADVPAAWTPPAPHRVAAFAIHGTGAARTYWTSCPLAGATPDFHQPDAFPPAEAAIPRRDDVALRRAAGALEAADALTALARVGPTDAG